MRIPSPSRRLAVPSLGGVLEVAGLGMITAGAWVMHLAAGLTVGGVALIWIGSSMGSRS